MNANVVHPAQGPAAGTRKRTDPLGCRLGDPLGSMDLAIHHHQHAIAAGYWAQGHLHGLQQIQRPIGTESGGRPHRSHQHNGAGIVDQQLQQPSGFLQRVRAMGDHHPDQLGVCCKGIPNARHQRAPVLKQQVGAVDIGDLLHRDRRQVLQLRHRCKKGITPEHASGVIIQRCTVVCTAGDGAAGGQQQQAVHCSRRRNASMKRCIWLVVPMLTRKHPSIKGLPAIERTRIPACLRAESTSATGR